MNIQDYLNQKKVYYTRLFEFIDDTNDSSDGFHDLQKILEEQRIIENPSEFRLLLDLILIISQNHHRHDNFYTKIKQILLYLSDKLKQTFTNSELFDFFKNDKEILLFLFEKDILKQDENINKYLLAKWLRNNTHLRHFFITELRSFVENFVFYFNFLNFKNFQMIDFQNCAKCIQNRKKIHDIALII